MHQAHGYSLSAKLLGQLVEGQGRARSRRSDARAGLVGGEHSGHSEPRHSRASDSTTALNLLAKRDRGRAPRVRIEALRALARIPTARAAELALSVLDKGQVEGFLEYALWLTINDLAEPWAAAVESGAWKIEGREKQLQYALKAIEPKTRHAFDGESHWHKIRFPATALAVWWNSSARPAVRCNCA